MANTLIKPTKLVLVGEEANPQVVFHEEVFLAMDQFAQENTDKEYGGVLLGKQKVKNNICKIFIEMFIPLPQQGESRFSIGASDWQLKVEHVKKDYPDYELVGWMHTHPGFGVFLSALDKRQHQQFFGDDQYKIAYIIDPEDLDRGLYCLKNGTDWERLTGYYVRYIPNQKNKFRGASIKKLSRKQLIAVGIAFIWLILIGATVYGFVWIRGFDDVQRGKVIIELDEENQHQPVTMRGTMTTVEESIWDLSTDDRGSEVIEEYEEYVVEQGDSLWQIAEDHLGDGQRYNEIIKINGLIKEDIRPGMRLKLPIDN